MGLKPDHWIVRMAKEARMIEPFEEGQVRDGVISYGVSSYGYDIRVADEFKIFTNVFSAVVDPKQFDNASMVDFKGSREQSNTSASHATCSLSASENRPTPVAASSSM